MAKPSNAELIAPIHWGEYNVPSLEGVHGRIEFVGPNGRVLMKVEDEKVTLFESNGTADCVISSDIPGELVRLIRGEINLITALLQGRIDATGDPMLVLKVAGSMPELGRQEAGATGAA